MTVGLAINGFHCAGDMAIHQLQVHQVLRTPAACRGGGGGSISPVIVDWTVSGHLSEAEPTGFFPLRDTKT